MYKIAGNILELIWNTPLVKINKLNPNPKVTIYAKLEWFNPTGSIKDRIALKLVEQAEIEWTLKKWKVIIEPTSGNTGIALAMIWVVKGYGVEIIMSSAVSIERRKMIEAFWWKIILTPKKLWTDWAIMKVKELVKKYPNKYFMPDQYSNKYNKLAHYHTTAREILMQTWWKIDYLVSALWTSWTIMWIWKYLKENNSKIKIVCAEPVKWHYIQGLKNMGEALVPAIYDPKKIDINILIETEEAFKMARLIAKKEWIFVWMSSWAAMLAAVKLAKKIKSWIIVVIFPDRWEKYLSTKLFN
jgi:S-sulfo-L-cysteine synthase (O-acetyl-L-serine-dependent)